MMILTLAERMTLKLIACGYSESEACEMSGIRMRRAHVLVRRCPEFIEQAQRNSKETRAEIIREVVDINLMRLLFQLHNIKTDNKDDAAEQNRLADIRRSITTAMNMMKQVADMYGGKKKGGMPQKTYVGNDDVSVPGERPPSAEELKTAIGRN